MLPDEVIHELQEVDPRNIPTRRLNRNGPQQVDPQMIPRLDADADKVGTPSTTATGRIRSHDEAPCARRGSTRNARRQTATKRVADKLTARFDGMRQSLLQQVRNELHQGLAAQQPTQYSGFVTLTPSQPVLPPLQAIESQSHLSIDRGTNPPTVPPSSQQLFHSPGGWNQGSHAGGSTRLTGTFERVEKVSRAPSKCTKCHALGHTRTSKACPLRYTEVLSATTSELASQPTTALDSIAVVTLPQPATLPAHILRPLPNPPPCSPPRYDSPQAIYQRYMSRCGCAQWCESPPARAQANRALSPRPTHRAPPSLSSFLHTCRLR